MTSFHPQNGFTGQTLRHLCGYIDLFGFMANDKRDKRQVLSYYLIYMNSLFAFRNILRMYMK